VERRTSPVELLWDLVFVFAVTQVSTTMGRDLTWPSVGRSLLLLALVWWAWSAFVWAANAEDEDSRLLRVVLLVALVMMFLAGVALPSAFLGEAAVFVASYAAVRFLHLGIYADASRRGNASLTAIAGFAATVAIGMALLAIGAAVGGAGQVVFWGLAAAIDYAGPAWLTRERLRGLQRVAVSHFAERYGLFIIIVLGESVVAIGTAATHHVITASLLAAFAFGLTITIALWWLYFDRTAAWAEQRLREADDPVLAAADAFSYLHLLLVTGVVLLAVGEKAAVTASAQSLPLAARLSLCGGVALYVLGYDAFKWRLGGQPSWLNAAAIAAMAVLAVVTENLAAWAVCGLVATTIVALCAAKTLGAVRADHKEAAVSR
jgi:low temperature requirement protein LtrA